MKPLLTIARLVLLSIGLLLPALVQAESLETQLDQYLQLTNDNPAKATELILQLEKQLAPDTPALTRARIWSYLSSDYLRRDDYAKAQQYIDFSLELAEQSQSI